jgi:hypothetical protein
VLAGPHHAYVPSSFFWPTELAINAADDSQGAGNVWLATYGQHQSDPEQSGELIKFTPDGNELLRAALPTDWVLCLGGLSVNTYTGNVWLTQYCGAQLQLWEIDPAGRILDTVNLSGRAPNNIVVDMTDEDVWFLAYRTYSEPDEIVKMDPSGTIVFTAFGLAQDTLRDVAAYVPPSAAPSVDVRVEPETIVPRSNGLLKVAILSSQSFDALQIDPLSVRFGPLAAPAERVSVHDVNRDGGADLVAAFRIAATGIASATPRPRSPHVLTTVKPSRDQPRCARVAVEARTSASEIKPARSRTSTPLL